MDLSLSISKENLVTHKEQKEEQMSTMKTPLNFLSLIFCMVIVSGTVVGQTTAFTYQGSLSEAGNPVTGTRFFRFTLFDENGAAIPGASLDQTLIVTNGIFNASLDFGAGVFPGPNRSLEIAVKIDSGDPFTILHPLQAILAAPYAITSKEATNATQLGGVNSTLFVQQDAGGNVSIAGDFSVNGLLSLNTVNAQTQYNLGGQRILSVGNGDSSLTLGSGGAGNSNAGAFGTFLGQFAGVRNTGGYNTFVGNNVGNANTTGGGNSFFGAASGVSNTTGNGNSFFGTGSGFSNTTGFENAFFGHSAGNANQTGADNSFFGAFAGLSNTTGLYNTLLGAHAGDSNTTGTGNTYVGTSSGAANRFGNNNSFFGLDVGRNNTASGNSFFGAQSGLGTTTGDANAFVGSSAGQQNTTGRENAFFGANSGFPIRRVWPTLSSGVKPVS